MELIKVNSTPKQWILGHGGPCEATARIFVRIIYAVVLYKSLDIMFTKLGVLGDWPAMLSILINFILPNLPVEISPLPILQRAHFYFVNTASGEFIYTLPWVTVFRLQLLALSIIFFIWFAAPVMAFLEKAFLSVSQWVHKLKLIENNYGKYKYV